jgi:hypothetical protein
VSAGSVEAPSAPKEDYADARPVLDLLVTRFPKRAYWVHLSLIYGASDDYPESPAVQQLAYSQGLLVEDPELRRLARARIHFRPRAWYGS